MSSTATSTSSQIPISLKFGTELLLLVFIHGFKGTDETFGDFPKRIEHLLTESIPDATVESVIFPAYETKGELDKAIVRFADWLATLVVEREVSSGLGAGKAKIVLCGHSMGGLLAADTLRELDKTRTDKSAPLWPNIIACIAYDTPYLGLHPFVVKHSVTKAAQYANAATTVGSALLGSLAGFGAKKASQPPVQEARPSQTSWTSWAGPAAVGGALIATAAAGVAYYRKEDLGNGISWTTEHMKFVGNLFDVQVMEKRVEDLIDIEHNQGVIFRNLYTVLPPKPSQFLTTRTFIVPPKYGSRSIPHFKEVKNNIATDEIQGHTGMFSGNTNDGYYQLGLQSVEIIQEALLTSRGIVKGTGVEKVTSPTGTKQKKNGIA